MSENVNQKSALMPLGAACGWNFLFALIFMFVFVPFYEVNDDFYISSIAAGIYAQSSAYTGFGNVLLGQALQFLYGIAHGVPWYLLFNFALIYFGCVLMTVTFSHALGITRGLALMTCMLLLFVGTQFYIGLNWTRSAAIACLGGYMAMIDGVRRSSPGFCAAGGLLMAAGSILRFDGWLIASALSGVAGVYLLWPMFIKVGEGWLQYFAEGLKTNWKTLLVCVLAEVLVIAAYGVNHSSYRSDEWAEFTAFNALRYQVTELGTPGYEENKEAYEALGLTANDVNMLSSWTYADPEVFDIETMEKIHALQNTQSMTLGKLVRAVKDTIMLFWNHQYFTFGILVSMLGLVLSGGSWKRILGIGALTGMTLFLLLYLVMGGRYNDRALVGIGLAYVMLVLLILTDEAVPVQGSKRAGALTLMMVIGFCICLRSQYFFSPYTYMYLGQPQEERTASIRAVAEEMPDENLYLMDISSGLPFDTWYTVWQMPERGMLDNIYSLGGWTTKSPVTDKTLEKYGVENIYRAVYTRDDVFFSMGKLPCIQMNITHIEEHYAPQVHWSVADCVLTQYIVAVQEPITAQFPMQQADLQVAKQSEDDEFIWLGGHAKAETGVQYLRLTDFGGEQYTARIKMETDGSFCVGIAKSELPAGQYSVQLLHKNAGADTCTWQSESVNLTV